MVEDGRTPMTSGARVQAEVKDPGACALTAWIFDSPTEAEATAAQLVAGPEVARLGVDDAAVVSWEPAAPRPRIRRFPALASTAALGDDFWALVLGVTFRVPLLGAAVAGAAGAAGGSLTAAGITERFMNRLRDELTPGRSALLVLGQRATTPAAVEAFPVAERPQTVVATITPTQVAALREVFASP
jgi:uncharacterized membrane protein